MSSREIEATDTGRGSVVESQQYALLAWLQEIALQLARANEIRLFELGIDDTPTKGGAR